MNSFRGTGSVEKWSIRPAPRMVLGCIDGWFDISQSTEKECSCSGTSSRAMLAVLAAPSAEWVQVLPMARQFWSGSLLQLPRESTANRENCKGVPFRLALRLAFPISLITCWRILVWTSLLLDGPVWIMNIRSGPEPAFLKRILSLLWNKNHHIYTMESTCLAREYRLILCGVCHTASRKRWLKTRQELKEIRPSVVVNMRKHKDTKVCIRRVLEWSVIDVCERELRWSGC
jgi:hypothetical protein